MSTPQVPHISADSFHYAISTSPSSAQPSSPIVIYLISGNPGLIAYYHTFLSFLSENIKSQAIQQEQKCTYHVYGHSLAGFELEERASDDAVPHARYYDLEEQIRFVQNKLDTFIATLTGVSAGASSNPKPKVILIGHSVGSYIAMETLRRHRDRTKSGDSPIDFDIIGGAMLFPTVVDIAKSPSGQKLTRMLYFIPQLALVAGLLVRVLAALVPHSVLRFLVSFYMGSPPDGAVDTTTAFIGSVRGVRQALHMAADEMRTITSDQWSDDVWGMSTVRDPVSRLFFYFGRNDHWVAERTRDEIIELRGQAPDGPKMVVCEEGLPHAFCLRHSEVMAKKVATMIMDITAN
ncbi:uncharacterized conserved protein DUF2305 [Aspergillus terreus]|uniref:Uncharacterized conserved protein DUF2305 n=1 Tax=Aspergillus terreus TaxID=33178 RepID=A0A5M3ZEL3_ASPTE|nr:hypothetical protein ATETN484_0013032600 [Aspergillus terreus]GFF20560.1 uncharacterized conserved protein DUF2305 [Aspergillus terreus]